MLRKAWTWTKRFVIGFFALSILSTIFFRFVPVPVTPLMLIRVAEQLAAGQSPKLVKDWEPISRINQSMVLAVVAAEDQKFTEHFGFDIEAIQKAMKQNEKLKARGKPIKGGSTISQQCAKNVFLWPGRNLVRKGLEAYFTLLIEIFWSKRRIMEVYLNVIEMGDGIYGAQAAARTYFKTDAANLKPSQAALIAAVLPNPRKWNPAKPTAYITKRKGRILRQMGYIRGTVDL